jgi:hypothetical protein
MLGRMIIFMAVIVSLWWAADYDYDMLSARSEEILFWLFNDCQDSLEGAPLASIAKIYPCLDQSRDSLRILTLLPARSGTIKCRTQATTFSQQPRYRALSYEWGSSEITLPIRINGVDTRIRKNLWYALYNIRHPKEEVVLWIDAVCINQQDLGEKARLVPQMSLVYQRAEEVLVWLGRMTPPDVVKAYLPRIAKWQSPPPEISPTYHAIWWEKAVPWLYQLAHVEYWQRTWIIQEIGEAVKLTVHFGDSSLQWDAFISLVNAFRSWFPYVTETNRIELLSNLRDSKRNGDIYSLADLVWQFRNSFCKVPQDKLYAFLGMADDDPTSSLSATYDRSLHDVYSDFVQYLARSVIDSATKEVQIVQRSALMRHLLVRRAGKVQHTSGMPCSVFKQDDPYTYHYTEKNSEGKETLQTYVDYRKKWTEWEECTSEHKLSCWLSSAPEQSEVWTSNHSLPLNRIKARGLLVGQIEHLGPTIEMFLMSDHVVRQWKLSK